MSADPKALASLVCLSAGRLTVDLAPTIGGAIADFSCDGQPLLRRTPEAALRSGDVWRLACFPLAPYSNRIANGSLILQGIKHQLTRNFGRHPHSIHGNAWQSRWVVNSATQRRAVLSLKHRPFGFGPGGPDGWPLSYDAKQVFELSDDTLTITLGIINRDACPMPTSLGWHPYFPRHRSTTLRFDAQAVWLNGADALPSQCVSLPPEWDFRTPRLLGRPRLDHCFSGWTGTAEIAGPGPALTIEADPRARFAVVYVPPDDDYFCFEPVTAMNDAVHHTGQSTDHGLVMLGPGQRLETTLQINVRP